MKDAIDGSTPAESALDARAERAFGQAGLPPDDVSRRKFLQVMGASLALASASSCRWDGEEILPFAKRPDGRVPGTTRRFATAFETNGVAAALLVTSYDGRPIKIEGNPLHPLDAGAASSRSQAAVLDLYDPDHSGGLAQTHERVTYPRTWKEFDPWFAGILAAHGTTGGAGLRVLAEPSSTLAFAAMRARFQSAFPRARWFEWTPITRTNELAGAKLAFGRAVRVQPRLDLVRTLVCLDADLLGEHPAALANARAFVRRRDPERGEPLRAWVVESTPSLTGTAADHRLALRAEQVLPFLLALEERLRKTHAIDSVGSAQFAAPVGGFLGRADVARALDRLAEELAQNRGASLLAVGPRQPAAVHDLAHRMNAALGNVGRTLSYSAEPEAERADPVVEIKELVREMEAATVACLVMLGGNPVHDAPADVDFRGALRRVPLSLHLSFTRDETSRASTWHLPRAHALEAWGDACSWDGTRCTVQPLIDPIFERRTPLELAAQLAGVKQGARELVRAAVAPEATDAQWKKLLHDGFVASSAFPSEAPALGAFVPPRVPPNVLAAEVANGELELVLAADPKVFDGRGANNAWLQELPDPITRATWGNAACFAPETARALGVEDATIVKLRLGERVLEVAAVVVPGQAPGSVTLRLGYGRTAAGRVGGLEEEGVESIGFDAYRLRASDALDVAHGLRVEPTGLAHALARTNDPQVTDA
ncbi:MAG: molybdopterin oxidoreductase, partial [Planctomycetes bacterium]|nr:molybdopterin oxidoreductase [Planctomycetota bacterium]